MHDISGLSQRTDAVSVNHGHLKKKLALLLFSLTNSFKNFLLLFDLILFLHADFGPS